MIDLVVRGDRGKQVVEVYIDNEDGVTTDMCAVISTSITQAIESAGLLLGSYRLDVSSPGINRPLKFPWQYRKHVGRPVTVLIKSESGIRQETGTLHSCDQTEIVLDIGVGKPQVRILVPDITEFRVNTPW